jgi:hypothetical protein
LRWEPLQSWSARWLVQFLKLQAWRTFCDAMKLDCSIDAGPDKMRAMPTAGSCGKAAQKGRVTLEPSCTFKPFRAFSSDDFVRSKNSCWITIGTQGSWQKKSQVKHAFFGTV